MRLSRSLKWSLFSGLAAVTILGLLLFFLKPVLYTSVSPPHEYAALAAAITKSGALWVIPRDAAVQSPDGYYVMRVERLRAMKIRVIPGDPGEHSLLVDSDLLRHDDLLLLNPASIPDGAALAIKGGVEDRRLMELTVSAGIAAAEEENLVECARFISPRYEDQWGFTYSLLTALLKRAFDEFDQPAIELTSPLEIDVHARSAVIRAGIRVQADYAGRRNYLLGGPHDFNDILVRMDKLDSGWKISEISGLKPLGFEEAFMKLLGAEIGLPLSASEKVRKKEACMPCRNTMAERFGASRDHERGGK